MARPTTEGGGRTRFGKDLSERSVFLLPRSLLVVESVVSGGRRQLLLHQTQDMLRLLG